MRNYFRLSFFSSLASNGLFSSRKPSRNSSNLKVHGHHFVNLFLSKLKSDASISSAPSRRNLASKASDKEFIGRPSSCLNCLILLTPFDSRLESKVKKKPDTMSGLQNGNTCKRKLLSRRNNSKCNSR